MSYALSLLMSRKEFLQYAALKEQNRKAVRGFREVGETFVYLGCTCIVRSHERFVGYLGWMPELQADYVDDRGVIHAISFSAKDIPLLEKHNLKSG